MTPSEIKAILSRWNGRANKALGQNFLIDPSVLEAILISAQIHPGERVLEVGPGLGVLTRALMNAGAEVSAIEQDRRFVEFLSGSDAGFELARRPAIVSGDAATIHWHTLVGNRPWKFVSNLPYSITSLALRKALWAPRPPEKLVVLVQREVAERAIAKDGKTSLLSLMVAFAASSARIVKRVPAGAFFPPPKVESAILEVIPQTWQDREKRWGIHPEKIMEWARLGFAHPRKLLASNIGLKTGERLISSLEEVGLNAKARAEDLSPEEWAMLARRLS